MIKMIFKTTHLNNSIKCFVLILGGIGLTGCLNNGGTPEIDDDFIQVISTQSHGNILADQDGMVLYYFTRDVSGMSQCEGDCIESWPVFFTNNFNPSAELDAEALDIITRPDGTSQLTYNGWPLYYFAGDDVPGGVNGDGVNDVWFAANPTYFLMIADEQLIGEDGINYTSDYEEGEEITTYITDAEGRTLYRFINDEANTNNFTSENFENNDIWPIFHTDIGELPSMLNEENFGEIMVHGEQQLTYRGWPLYYFNQDTDRGHTQGVSFPSPGIWPVVNTDTPEAP